MTTSQSEASFQYLKLRSENRVAYVTLNRPPVNALSTEVIAELGACLGSLAADTEVKAIVMTGEGKLFVAGADIKEFTGAFGNSEQGKQMALSASQTFQRIAAMTKPVICAINGAALGGGLELAMCCHLRIAAEDAQLGLPELKLGLIPGYGGTQRLARLVGQAKATEMILTSRPITGREAERVGLVNRAVPGDQLLAAAAEWAELIATERSSVSVAAALQAIAQGLDGTLEEGLQLEAELFGDLFVSEDMREGVTAFVEKRKAVFKDR
ncbi:enoyl-CoA hydratase [Paenibacillus kobensis]|uniref:enoyl-CoA hydratase n=1 Tax=Paenibacillus kobensis TaxID=59841 RepID=UPI000FDC84ED|nr:enoyl-CoA hydratase [Paenibacillus kobensis]